MPFLMQPEDFAEHAFRTIEAGSSYRVIPWQMGVVAKLMRVLPNARVRPGAPGAWHASRSGAANAARNKKGSRRSLSFNACAARAIQ